ncbi:Putative NADPH-quinone reductase (modulator of drug activity B) [Paraoerskovia marina]|uniref:Putative NADPH-quinone reductase (Modulator of drug activity B) n=1 Tax=Paraoerskovia marina TaxID=545619 RepID=A0A1H1RLT8_9CELL|nr:NAD(P)H-dependent oxidoreductase [Paraoerskovia marina]SDS36664.1 Putative NADPH-quinone reductase (modulator of drug activity B) [Paraoerskovia marina]
MKILLVVDHPYPGSLTRALTEAVARGADAHGHDVDVIDLDADDFDPVMRLADLAAWRGQATADPRVVDYQRRILDADHLVVVSPVWWASLPARLKGFLDKVLVPGFAYDDGPLDTLVGRLGHLRGVTVMTTMTTPVPVFRWWYGDPVGRMLGRGTFRQLGVRHVRHLRHGRPRGVGDARRAAWLGRAERLFGATPGRPSVARTATPSRLTEAPTAS